MKHRSERGVALVITLVMLAVVTLMAVTFLAVSRRERSAVTVTEEQTTSRLMADAALARAQVEAVAKMMARSNILVKELLVSTNFIERLGFAPNQAPRNSNFTNVNYDYRQDGRPLSRDEALVNLTNLLYDPRPPVYVRTNDDPKAPLDSRFYLDLNRNWRFETNGELPIMSWRNNVYDLNGNEVPFARGQPCQSNFFVGDPEWIGVLQSPDWPHSPSNRFIGRYAYVLLPAGKSLDWNFIHNHVLRVGPNEDAKLAQDGFYRNQGVGSWELNLAGFLRDLNTNVWRDYFYTPLGAPSLTEPFQDALGFLRYRYAGNCGNLKSVNWLYGPRGAAAFQTDDIDGYSDGPPEGGGKVLENLAANKDRPDRPWAGSDNPGGYYEAQELFDVTKVPGQGAVPYLKRLLDAQTNNDSYNRYTFYRMLSQIGMDSAPANRGKINLNYNNVYTNNATNFTTWRPLDFFMIAADRLLEASRWTNIYTNRLGFIVTNIFVGDTQVATNFAINNILVYGEPGTNSILLPPIGDTSVEAMLLPAYGTTLRRAPLNSEYTPSVHRLLQVAANVYDAMTNRLDVMGRVTATNAPPSVFRPRFVVRGSSIYVADFVEVTNTAFLNLPFYDPHERSHWAPMRQAVDFNLYGVPLVVGAKKGLPNFNEFSLLSMAQVTRKVLLQRKAAGSVEVTNLATVLTDAQMQEISEKFSINQLNLVSVSNRLGIECWNSYTQDYRRSLRMRVEGDLLQTLVSTNRGVAGNRMRITAYSNHYGANVSLTGWNGNSFMLPVHTNLIFLPNSPYHYQAGIMPFDLTRRPQPPDDSSRFYTPQWVWRATNRFYYALIDTDTDRVLDFASFSGLNVARDLTARVEGRKGGGGGAGGGTGGGTGGAGGAVRPMAGWSTNRYGDSQAAADWTYGVKDQIAYSCGKPDPGNSVWRSYNAEVNDKVSSQRHLADFLANSRTGFTNQAGYSPSYRLRGEKSWQVNDPLVHYMAGDLARLDLTSAAAIANDEWLVDEVLPVTETPADNRNLNVENVRIVYRPWGAPGTEDVASYDPRLKDPLVRKSDDWDFPTNKFPNLGWLGRVHRGTPWQTIYLKSSRVALAGWGVDTNDLLPCVIAGLPGTTTNTTWYDWAFSLGTHPTNDWKFVDLFTVAANDNAAQGLLSVNQDRLAAWSAVLSGVSALTNTTPASRTNNLPGYAEWVIEPDAQPNSPQLRWMVKGINRTRSYQTNGVFNRLGDLLATPELTFASPFISTANLLNDTILERIPRQILSLVKADEPRFVVYAFGQSLKEAPNSIYLGSGPFYQLCTNYQVRGEFAAKAVFRVEGPVSNPRVVVESYHELPAE